MNWKDKELVARGIVPEKLVNDLLNILELVYEAGIDKGASKAIKLATLNIAVCDLKFDLDALLKAKP